LRCEWEGQRTVRLEVRAGRRTVAVAVALELVVLAPPDALAAELESHLAAALGQRWAPNRPLRLARRRLYPLPERDVTATQTPLEAR
jgi:hypothetical protein